jgi:hypothetical protein
MTLIPNLLILLARWVFGYNIVLRHVPPTIAIRGRELDPQFVLTAPPGETPADNPPPMNIDDYNGMIALLVGFLLAWAVASLVSMLWTSAAARRADKAEQREIRSTMSFD